MSAGWLFRYCLVLAFCAVSAWGGTLTLERDWLPAASEAGSLKATLVDAGPDAFQLIQTGQMKVRWKGAVLDTEPIYNEPSFEFTVPAELRTPGLTEFTLWDAARGLPLAFSGRVAIIILTPAEIFEVAPEINRVVAYEPDEGSGVGGRIAVYALSTGGLVETIPLVAPQQVLAFTPDMQYAWIAENLPAGELARFGLSSRQLDQRFQVTAGFPPHVRLRAQVDRGDPSLLIVEAQFPIRVFRNGSALPGADRFSHLFPLPMDDRGRYIVDGDEACRLDSSLGFTDCVVLPKTGVTTLWKEKLRTSGNVFDATTLELLAAVNGDAFYLPDSNRLVAFYGGAVSFFDGDLLEEWLKVSFGANWYIGEIRRIFLPDWFIAGVGGSLIAGGLHQRGILATRLPELDSAPTFTESGVVHGGAFTSGAVAPGEIVSIFGANLGSEMGASLLFESQLRLTTEVEGVRVLFDGAEGTILYAGTSQINVVAPGSLEGKPEVEIQVVRYGIPSLRIQKNVVRARPGLFGYFEGGRRYAAALHLDGRLQGPATPVSRGAPVALYGTGLGLPRGLDADRIADRAAATPVVPRVTIGGREAEVLYSGAAPGLTAGLFQVNVVVPPNAPVGPAVEVVIEADGRAEGNTWLAVQ